MLKDTEQTLCFLNFILYFRAVHFVGNMESFEFPRIWSLSPVGLAQITTIKFAVNDGYTDNTACFEINMMDAYIFTNVSNVYAFSEGLLINVVLLKRQDKVLQEAHLFRRCSAGSETDKHIRQTTSFHNMDHNKAGMAFHCERWHRQCCR